MTFVSSNEGILPPHFVFKRIGAAKVRDSVRPPKDVLTLWVEKGSYRLETMLETIQALPNYAKRDSIPDQTYKHYQIMLLDDYSVHLAPEVQRH